MEWIDICANLTHESFKRDLDAVVERAADAGVRWLLVTGSDEKESERCIQLAESYPGHMRATLGVHPHHASQWEERTAYRFAEDATHPLVVAMGEMGLDYYRNHSVPAAQRHAFEAQLELAADLRKPVFLHEREASRDFGDILQRYRDRLPAAVVHCFTSDVRSAGPLPRDGLPHRRDRDGSATSAGARTCSSLVPRIPDNRLLLETDAPYLLPRTLPKGLPHGRRNEPAFLPHIGGARREAPRMLRWRLLALQTSANARAFYALPEAS
jgi:TatD DNase family protein